METQNLLLDVSNSSRILLLILMAFAFALCVAYGALKTQMRVHVHLLGIESAEGAHGWIWLKDKNGQHARHAFQVSNPDLIVKPTKVTMNSFYKELERMGFIPLSVEVTLAKPSAIYRPINLVS